MLSSWWFNLPWYKVKNHLKQIQENGIGPFPEIALKIDSGCFLENHFSIRRGDFLGSKYTLIFQFPIYLEPGVDRSLLATVSNRFQLHKELEDQGTPLKFNMSPLKNDLPNRKVVFQPTIFHGLG